MKNIFLFFVLIFCSGLLFAQNPELVVQKGHGFKITCFAFSPDGKFIVSGSMDNTLKLWDIQTGKEIRTLTGHKGIINSVTFSENGKFILSTSSDRTVKQWDFETGIEIRTFSGHTERVLNAIYYSDDSEIISGSDDNVIKFWDIKSGKEIKTIEGRKTYIESIDFSKDGKYALSGSKDNKIRYVDLSSGEIVKNFQGKFMVLGFLSFSKDGKMALSGDGVDMVLWNIEKQQELRNFKGHNNTVNYVSFSNDGKLGLSVCSQEDKFNIWELESGKLLKSITSQGVYSAVFSPDNKFILTGHLTELGAGVLKLWNTNKGTEVKTFAGYASSITSADFFPDGKSFITTSGFGKYSVRKWDLFPGIDLKPLPDNGKTAQCVAISSDGKIIATGNTDNSITIWDAESLSEMITLTGHKLNVKSIKFSNNGKYLISGSLDNMIKIWDISSGNEIGSLIGFTSSFSISRDDKLIVTGSNELIRLFDLENMKKILSMTGHTDSVMCVSISPDGDLTVSGSLDGTVKIWETKNGTLVKDLIKIPNPIYSVLFSGDEKFILLGEGDGALKKIDLATGNIEYVYKGHIQAINNILISPLDQKILTTGFDKSVVIWDQNVNKDLVTSIAVGDNNYVCLTHDNYYMATKGGYIGVAFRVGNKVFPFEQFDIQYNRPDIVLEKLGYAPIELIESYRKAYFKRLKKLNFNENMFRNDFHVPEIKISSENIPPSTNNKKLSFNIEAKDTKYSLDRVNVFLNDVPVYGTSGINLRKDNLNSYNSTINVELISGRNKIQTSVLNDKGVESLKETIEINYEGGIKKSDLYVVAIGCSDYNDPKYKLTYAAKDANDLTKLFKDKQGEYGEVKVMKLLDKEVTKENILKAKEFLMQTRVDDEVIVFIAGHGLLNKDYDYYYATSDIDFRNPEARGITFDEIESLLDGIPALKKILFMDTCHSGEVDKEDIVAVEKQKEEKGEVTFRDAGDVEYREKEGTRLGLKNTNQLLQELFVDLRRGSGAMVISSAGGMEFAWEGGDFKNGLFTYSLLDGLKNRKADMNSDGMITVSELRDYVSKTVEDLTGGKQKPTMRRENIEFDFKVW